MARKFLVFQHSHWEGPGKYLVGVAKKNKLVLDIIHLWRGDAIPDLSEYNGLIVLGGSANVGEEDQFPFLVQEKKAIQKALHEDKAYLGFCLGHQLLADALGAKVGPNFCRSIGFIQGHLTHDGRDHPVFRDVPKKFPIFKWHGQAVKTPVSKKISILATSGECQVEAISVQERPHIIGVQFDNHAANSEDIALWFEKDRKWVFSCQERGVSPSIILSCAKNNEEQMRTHFEIFFENFIRLVP